MPDDEYDPLDDLPPDSRADVIAGVLAVLALDVVDDDDDPIDEGTAEDVVRASEPLWDALEELGLVDTWGGMEFVALFPEVVAFIAQRANSA
jgi:hypothetical protein